VKGNRNVKTYFLHNESIANSMFCVCESCGTPRRNINRFCESCGVFFGQINTKEVTEQSLIAKYFKEGSSKMKSTDHHLHLATGVCGDFLDQSTTSNAVMILLCISLKSWILRGQSTADQEF